MGSRASFQEEFPPLNRAAKWSIDLQSSESFLACSQKYLPGITAHARSLIKLMVVINTTLLSLLSMTATAAVALVSLPISVHTFSIPGPPVATTTTTTTSTQLHNWNSVEAEDMPTSMVKREENLRDG